MILVGIRNHLNCIIKVMGINKNKIRIKIKIIKIKRGMLIIRI